MNIILIGLRGSGKTTIGKLLAKKLDRDFIETDELIEQKVSEKISDFVGKNGWKKFRQIESEIIKGVAILNNAIISTGGGIVEKAKNIKLLRRNGFIIYFNASIDTLLRRISDDNNRPFLSDAQNMKQDLLHVWQKRKKLYEDYADRIINVDNKSISKITKEILESISNL